MDKRFYVLMVALVVAISMVAVADNPYVPSDPSYIQGTGVVQTSAEITGNGCPPNIEYIWALPDEDPLTSGTQVWPYSSVERTDLYGCIVVSDPNGRDDLADVYVDVYHPEGAPECGSKKYQKHAVKLDIVDDAAEIEACKAAALRAGLITQSDFDDIDYMIFDQPGWYMYKVDLRCNYCQPAGMYEVRGFAVDRENEISAPKSTSFTWIESVILEIDFIGGINFGVLAPEVHQWVHGDADMGTASMPTVKNEGNVPIAISVSASKMTGAMYQKEIVQFDSMFRDEYVQFEADNRVTFQKPLELCTTRKIDFSVMAPYGTPKDSYTGSMTIYAAKGQYETTCEP